VIPKPLRNLGATLELPSGELLRELLSNEILASYLQRKLLTALAQQAPASAPDASQLQGLLQQIGLDDIDQLDGWRRSHAIDLELLEELAVYPSRLQAATEAIWGDEVPGRFLERSRDLDQVTLSLLRFEDADLAQELYFQLVEGELVFAQLLDRYGQTPGQPPRGLVGPVTLDKIHPLLARVGECYDPGALIPPLEINGTTHLIRVEQFNKAQLDGPMRQRLLSELCQRWLSEELQRLLQRLGEATSPSTPTP
jgi:hypothetical protein